VAVLLGVRVLRGQEFGDQLFDACLDLITDGADGANALSGRMPPGMPAGSLLMALLKLIGNCGGCNKRHYVARITLVA